MKCVKLIKLSLRVRGDEGLSITEIVEWINRGMQDYCEFDYCEIEPKDQTEENLDFELRILTQERASDSQSFDTLMKALKEYCDFDDVSLELIETHDSIWVTDNYEIPASS